MLTSPANGARMRFVTKKVIYIDIKKNKFVLSAGNKNITKNNRKWVYLRALLIQMSAYTCIQVLNGFIINT